MNTKLRHSFRSRRVPTATLLIQIPRSLAVAMLVLTGIWLSEALNWGSAFSIVTCFGCLVVSAVFSRWKTAGMETTFLCLAIAGLGASMWTVRNSSESGRDIGLLATEDVIDSETAIRLTGVLTNIPALDSVADSRPAGMTPSEQPRTLFLIRAKSLEHDGLATAVTGTCRVIIDGDATALLRWGDRVELTGQIDLAQSPLNPGEFDYAQLLKRNRISAMMFLKHPNAARVIESSRWNPGYWLTEFRQQTVALLGDELSPRNRATAEALLLGNRGHLMPDLQRDFMTSGTMHLLAISGLHVGILYVFLLRIMNLLLVPRTRALILAGFVCVMYCLLTDLRPSVMRATVFILLHILGQVLYRDIRMGSLIGATTLLLVLFDPSMAFDVGAWLSFLAVGALGWVADRTPPPVDSPAPPDEPTWQDRIQDLRSWGSNWLGLSYRQMLAVTMLSAPLVATQFHLVSLTGMLINILLIPFTSVTLIFGYVFVAVGLAVPPIAFIPGFFFETTLSILNEAVRYSADFRTGFVTIPDLPFWFLPTYYLMLAASSFAARAFVRRYLRLSLLALVTISLWFVCQPPVNDKLVCTVLSVGHGNAVVVETPDGKVLLFDAGAMNRGERTADLISRFLWKKGYRMIDAVVISHPDMDHYNALAGLLDRIPIGQAVITTEFARSRAAAVRDVMQKFSDLNLQTLIVMNDDQLQVGDLKVQFLKATLNTNKESHDNASSVVAILSFQNRRICLPGDLEGEGQEQLLTSLPRCDLLLSPHHGSPAANTVELSKQTQPSTVVVSSRSDRMREKLIQTFADSDVWFTSERGAVSYSVSVTGDATLDSFLKPPD